MEQNRIAIVIVMGAAGAGKTTVGARLAHTLGWAFLDADALHPPENVAKMRRGIPLNEADRVPWLERVRGAIEKHFAAGERAVIACSALRRAYRARLRVDPRVRFVYLKGAEPLLRARLESAIAITRRRASLPASSKPSRSRTPPWCSMRPCRSTSSWHGSWQHTD